MPFGGFSMKKLGLLIAISFLTMGTAFAQNWGFQQPQSVSVNGTLQLQNGQIVVVNGNTFYYVPTLQRYVGFIDGLREGARISIDGFVNGNFMVPTKLNLNGKTYDFSANTGFASGFGYGGCGGYGMMGAGGYGRRGGWGACGGW